MIKRALVYIIAVSMLLPAINVFGAYPSDISGHWAYGYLADWFDNGFIVPYPDGTFKPNKPITRAEFCSIANKAFGFSIPANGNFTDIKTDNPYYQDIAIAYGAGYLSGYDDKTIRPGNYIKRQEAAVMVAKALNLTAQESYADSFTDSKLLTFGKGAVGAVAAAEIIKGFSDGSFKPNDNITRAQAVIMLKNAYYRTIARLDQSIYAPPQELNDRLDNINYNSNSGSILAPKPNKTDQDLIIDRANYGESKVENISQNVIVESLRTGTIKNLKVTGDFTIESVVGRGDGTIVLDSVEIYGTLYIYSGVDIRLKDCITNDIVYQGSSIPTITSEGETKTGTITLYENAIINNLKTVNERGFRNIIIEDGVSGKDSTLLHGKFNKVYLKNSYSSIVLSNCTVSDLTVTEDGTHSTINIYADSTVDTFEAKAACTVIGKGKIKTSYIRSSGVTSSIIPESEVGDRPSYNVDPDGTQSSPGKYTVTYYVMARNEQPLSGAKVNFNGIEKSTGSEGNVSFIDISAGSYSYTASKEGYATVRANQTVSGPVNTRIYLDENKKFHAQFVVKENGVPVSGAIVNVGGKSATTDSNGIATITDLVEGDYTYSAEYLGTTKTGSFTVNYINIYINVDFD